MKTQGKTKDVKVIPYKEKIGIRGNKERGEEIIKYFKNLGANNINNYKCDCENILYYINDCNEIDCSLSIDDNFKVFNIEDLIKNQKCKNQ